jgi:hypothetical protein
MKILSFIYSWIRKIICAHISHIILDANYRIMAKDKVREKEALEWAEGTIVDCYEFMLE